jgi:hypothetical protein
MGKKNLKYDRREFILNFAKTSAGRLEISYEDYRGEETAVSIAQKLSANHGKAVREHLHSTYSPAVLGKLADCGIGKDDDIVARTALSSSPDFKGGVSMAEAMGGCWLSDRKYGWEILLDLATAALIAAMADVIFDHHDTAQYYANLRYSHMMRSHSWR